MSGAGEQLIAKRDASRKGCKIWDGATNSSGYPVMRDGDDIVLVHRKVAGATGDKPVHHTCGNKKCVKKSHLKITSHRENILASDGPAARKAKQTHCDKGHSLSDAYVWKDPEGRKHRRCRKCKLDEVKKHLKGKHDQKSHGNWASELAGGISPSKRKDLIKQFSTTDPSKTMDKVADWIKGQKGSIPLMAWVGADGGVLDVDLGTGGKGNWLDEVVFDRPDKLGRKIPPYQDRLQRVFNRVFNFGSDRKRSKADGIVVKVPGSKSSRPFPTDLDDLFDMGVKRAEYVSNDGETRRLEIAYDKWQPGTRDRVTKSWYGFTGWRVFQKFHDNNPELSKDDALDKAIRLKRSQGQSALPIVTGDEAMDALDEALEAVSGRTKAYKYYVNGEQRKRQTINPTRRNWDELMETIGKEPTEVFARVEKRFDVTPELQYHELSPAPWEPIMESGVEQLKKHLLGMHDQKKHGRWAVKDKALKAVGISTTHSRDEHRFLRDMAGKINLFRDELKANPNLQEGIEWLRSIEDYAKEFGRDLIKDQRVSIKAAEIDLGRDLKREERASIARGVRKDPDVAREAERILIDQVRPGAPGKSRQEATLGRDISEPSLEDDAAARIGDRHLADLSFDEKYDLFQDVLNERRKELVDLGLTS